MDSHPDVKEHESSAKRLKLDLGPPNIGELCNAESLSYFSTTVPAPIDVSEGISADCDSGYEASTMESIPTPNHQTSPHSDSVDIQESLSSFESLHQTPTHIVDQLETSQDSLEVDDDNASTVSHISDLSGLSELSGQDWKPMAGSMIWIQKQMQNGVNPRTLLTELGVDLEQVPQYVDDLTLWKIIINMLAEPPRRHKLRHVNTLDDVVRLLKGAQKIIVLTGAGVSVSCGIPDFRSRDGIYARLAVDFPDLPDPQAMFDINYFSQDPRPFFKFARDIYPGKFKPSPCHRFIKLLEKHGKLLRNYTQNIDTLEKEANIQNVIECHGSFATATCTRCSHKVTADQIRDLVLAQQIPLCPVCHEGKDVAVSTADNGPINYRELVWSGIMKPDIVFFGEGLPDTFHDAMAEDKTECDLLLVIGSSLKVRPVALIPSSLPSHVPQILINREPLPHCHFDVELLGDCDVIINHLCQLLGSSWAEGVYDPVQLKAASLLPLDDNYEVVDTAKSKNNPITDSNTIMNRDDKETEPNCKILLDNKLLDNNASNMNVVADMKNEKCSRCELESTNSSTKDATTSSSTTNNFCDNDDEEVTRCVCHFENKSIIIGGSTSSSNNIGRGDDYVMMTKERHMSIDSARDSGIGENSNFTDLDPMTSEASDQEPGPSSKSGFDEKLISTTSHEDLRGYWQPKIKKSLADRLPKGAFHLIPPSRYVFPGAEIYYDPDDEKISPPDSSSSSDSDESDFDESSGTPATVVSPDAL